MKNVLLEALAPAGNCFCVLDFEITSVPLLNFFF